MIIFSLDFLHNIIYVRYQQREDNYRFEVLNQWKSQEKMEFFGILHLTDVFID